MNPAQILIRVASWLVPSERRTEWNKEWLAELHYARQRAGANRSFAFARGAFHDAIWQQRDFWTLKRMARLAQSPWFCLGSLAAAIVLIALASGFLPKTRMAVMPLPYRDAARVITIAQSGTMATRSGMTGEAVDRWRSSSYTLEGVATYRWESPEVASVSEDFFYLLGAKTTAGRPFGRDAFGTCTVAATECAILSYDYWRNLHGASSVLIDGKSYAVGAVTERGFWFLSSRIEVWRLGSPSRNTRTGVVARLATDVTPKEAEAELGTILRSSGMTDWESMVELTQVRGRVHFVFGLFGFAVVLSALIVLPTLHFRMPRWHPGAAAFFAAKTALLLIAILLAGIEFTRASSINMLGGADGFIAISTWLFLLGGMIGLVWSISDQRQRCRDCSRRLGLATHVGCPGCLLLDWSGTELVCMEGHGMLHIPEMVACWEEPYRWTRLDETWQGLFAAEPRR